MSAAARRLHPHLRGFPQDLPGPVSFMPDIWDNPLNICARLPDVYKKFYFDWKNGPQTAVHWIPDEGKWKRDKYGQIVPIQNIPIPVKYPPQHNQGLWGGEGVVKGYYKNPGRFTMMIPEWWLPALKKTVLYSEILDKHIKFTVTKRTLDLVDEHYGLDYYILKTPPSDLKSDLALKLRRKLLLALFNKEMYPDNPEKRDKIYEKYKQFLIPAEELEWHGLTLREACTKQLLIEHEENKPIPKKHQYRMEFLQEIKEREKQDGDEKGRLSSLLAKYNPFHRIEKADTKPKE